MTDSPSRRGPLAHLRIVEFAGIGPAPFAAMLLADLGADILRIDRVESAGRPPGALTRGRRSVALDLKNPADIQTSLDLVSRADALIEGFRPGVMERLGLGPEACLARNPRLVYGRMTGWGQTGPLAKAAGHDINYISLSGALNGVGTPERPIAPLNLAGDFGGGSLYLCLGLLAGVLHARQSGTGQVVDCSMVEGSASLMTLFYELAAAGRWGERGSNLLDGAAPFYAPFRCADGKWVSLGSIEPPFYALLLDKLGLAESVDATAQNDRAGWPAMKQRLEAVIETRTRAEWQALLEGSDVCFAPVLDLQEAPRHPHNLARESFVQVDGQPMPGVAPRFSATPGRVGTKPKSIGEDTASALVDWGVPERHHDGS
ncbi:MAG: carnitine dehydratase [Rhizobacter sp.]|nr:carnitine dehydratase [Rhizobacter sp.]